jgi:tetratricopeptide (TPR) repeat protein
MKNLKLFAVILLLSSKVLGQTVLDDARKEIDKENYKKAKKLLLPILADGSGDREKVAYYLGNAYLNDDGVDSAKIFYRLVGGAENKSPYGLLAYGRLTLLNGDLPTAKKLFDLAATKSRMRDSEVLYQIGDALFRPTIADLQLAISYFEDAYKLDNKNYMNMLELGDAYLKNNEGGKAMSKYESAADVNPKLTMAFMKIGRLDYSARTYDDAIIAYKKAIALEPDYALAHKELGEVYYLSKKYDLAKPEFKKYIELNQDDAEAKTRFLTFLFQNKEFEQCATEAQQMLQTDPNNYIILRALFYADFELQRYKDGLEKSQQFWMAAPTDKVKPYDYIYTAKLATKGGDTTMALKYFNIALQMDSTNADLLSDYAQLMYNTKRFYAAVAAYTKRIAISSPTFYDYYYLGRSNYYIALGFKSQKDNTAAQDSAHVYFTAADSAFANLTAKYATVPDSWEWRAKTNNNLDPEMKAGSAKPYYEGFIKVAEAATDPATQARYKNFQVEAYQYMGAYYLNAKDTGTARGYLQKALALDPENETTKELMKGL